MEVMPEKTLLSIPSIALCERFICSTFDKYSIVPSNRYVNLFDDASNSFRLAKEWKAFRLRVSNKLLLAWNICEFNSKCFGLKSYAYAITIKYIWLCMGNRYIYVTLGFRLVLYIFFYRIIKHAFITFTFCIFYVQFRIKLLQLAHSQWLHFSNFSI